MRFQADVLANNRMIFQEINIEPEGKAGPAGGSSGNGNLFEAFQALRPALTRFLSARGVDPSDLEDVLQDMAIRIVSPPDDQAIRNNTAFLFSMAANLVRDRRRRARTHHDDRHLCVEDVELHDPSAFVDDLVDSRIRLRRLDVALGKLPADQRRVFVLSRVKGHTLSMVAEETGLSISRTRKLLERSMAQLARKVWED